MKTLAHIKVFTAVLALSILSNASYAYNTWSAVYPSSWTTWGISVTTVSPSDNYIIEILVVGYLDSFWHSAAFCDAFGTNVGLGTAAAANCFLWRNGEDWWTQVGTHYFLEDDLNTFDEVSFYSIFW